MAAAWDDVGRASNLLQLLGVDAFGLVSMITQAALTARQNRDLCLQLAGHGRVVAGLLRELQGVPQLRRHPETRRPLEQLDDALRRAYLLVRSCGQELAARSYLYQLLTGAHTAAKLRAAEEEIDWYIRLIPVIGVVATFRGQGAGENSEDPTTSQRDDTVSHIDWEMIEHDTVINRTGREIHLHEDAIGQLHNALPNESLATVMADTFRELKIQGDDASSSIFPPEVQAHQPAKSRRSTISSDRKNRRGIKKNNWRVTQIRPKPVIKKMKKSWKDIVCYVCVVPKHVAQRQHDKKGKGPSQGQQ